MTYLICNASDLPQICNIPRETQNRRTLTKNTDFLSIHMMDTSFWTPLKLNSTPMTVTNHWPDLLINLFFFFLEFMGCFSLHHRHANNFFLLITVNKTN